MHSFFLTGYLKKKSSWEDTIISQNCVGHKIDNTWKDTIISEICVGHKIDKHLSKLNIQNVLFIKMELSASKTFKLKNAWILRILGRFQ